MPLGPFTRTLTLTFICNLWQKTNKMLGFVVVVLLVISQTRSAPVHPAGFQLHPVEPEALARAHEAANAAAQVAPKPAAHVHGPSDADVLLQHVDHKPNQAIHPDELRERADYIQNIARLNGLSDEVKQPTRRIWSERLEETRGR